MLCLTLCLVMQGEILVNTITVRSPDLKKNGVISRSILSTGGPQFQAVVLTNYRTYTFTLMYSAVHYIV